MDRLKIGDTVNWRGSWGKDEPVEVTVNAISKKIDNKEVEVDSVDWSEAFESRDVMVILDNGRWAYGFQISKA